MRIMVIGLGQMGLPIALNLLKAGHVVTGVDVAQESREAFAAAGGIARANTGDADAEVFITALASSKQVASIYLEPKGLIASAPKGSLFIDCSTIDISLARSLQTTACAAGHDMIDAPISGGVAAAQTGALTIMVGGPENAFQRARPILDVIGRRIAHAGASGAGLAVKICNNLVVGVTIGALSEAFALGERLGLDPHVLFDIMSNSSGQCWALANVCPAPGVVPSAPSSNSYKPGGKTSIMLKDMRLALNATADAEIPAPLTGAAASLYGLFAQAGGADMDCTGVFALLTGRWPGTV